jgi:enoyl-CoA hydratase/3-hydroxyacyl-CoA dehydrogenase
MPDSRADQPVLYEVRGDVACITLNRPTVLNALNAELVAELARHVEAAAADARAALVIVRGAGRAFCSGIDRTALANGSVTEQFFRDWIRALNCLEDMPKVSIAALHGYAIGGGLQLAVACDFRVAADDSILELGATRHGLIPDGAVLRLARLVGLGRAKQLTLLNERVSPREALAMGLVSHVCPPHDIEAALHSLQEKIAGASSTATAQAKKLINMSLHHDPRTLVEELIAAQDVCISSRETAEANQAWQQKRPPEFS